MTTEFKQETQTEAMRVLDECKAIMRKKSQDYQNEKSNVTQAMHYRRGIDSLFDIMQGKMYRIQSLIESGDTPNHESIEDSLIDLINYASFSVAYIRGKIPGQNPDRDMFNKPIEKKAEKSLLQIYNTHTDGNGTFVEEDRYVLRAANSSIEAWENAINGYIPVKKPITPKAGESILTKPLTWFYPPEETDEG